MGVAALAEHVVPDRHARDPVADLVDHTGSVKAEAARAVEWLATCIHPGTALPVDPVAPGRLDLVPGLARAGMRIRRVGQLDHPWAAGRSELQGCHRPLLTPVGVRIAPRASYRAAVTA